MLAATNEHLVNQRDQTLIARWVENTIAAQDFDQKQSELVLSDGFRCKFSQAGQQRYQKALQTVIYNGKVTPSVLLLSGTSESGKSEIGKTLLEKGIANRIKILRVVREELAPKLTIDISQSGEINRLLNNLGPSDMTILAKKLRTIILDTHCPLAIIETIKSPRVVEFFNQSQQYFNAITIFIDADYQLRLSREMHGKGISDRDKAEEMIQQKDLEKATFGNDSIREIADLIITNNGTIGSLRLFMQSLVEPILSNRQTLETMRPIFYG